MVGKPQQNFAFTTFANQTVSGTYDGPGLDGIAGTPDDDVTCTSGTYAGWVELASYHLSELGCVKRVRLGGRNTRSAGGKTPFCDITNGFMVNVDTNGDGIIDNPLDSPLFIFSVSCLDNPLTLDVNESMFCPLSSLIWEIDPLNTTSQATAQIFVSHTDSAPVTGGKIR